MNKLTSKFSDPEHQIGMCGVLCKGCPSYLKSCYGCRSMKKDSLQKRTSKWKCKKRICVNEKNLNHCGECPQLSCKLRYSLEKQYLEKYNIDLFKNCKQIQQIGAKQWLEIQFQKYTCPK